jgi:hypothetical protein
MDWSKISTVILSISSVLAALTTILKFGKGFAEQIRSLMARDKKPFVIARPRLLLALISLLVVSVAGLLFIRIPREKSHTATAAKPPSVATAGSLQMKAEGNGVVVGGQSGTGNDQKVIGTLIQSGSSGCTQNVGIGDNNTVNCKPMLPTMSLNQVEQVSALLVGAPKIRGKVRVWYESTNDENGLLARQLDLAFVKAGINSTVQGYGKTITGHVDYPGLSIAYVNKNNVNLANAIEKALLKANVINQPLKPDDRNMKDADDDLVFEVRNPT